MGLHKAHDLLAAAVKVPVETLDEASLPPPKPWFGARAAGWSPPWSWSRFWPWPERPTR